MSTGHGFKKLKRKLDFSLNYYFLIARGSIKPQNMGYRWRGRHMHWKKHNGKRSSISILKQLRLGCFMRYLDLMKCIVGWILLMRMKHWMIKTDHRTCYCCCCRWAGQKFKTWQINLRNWWVRRMSIQIKVAYLSLTPWIFPTSSTTIKFMNAKYAQLAMHCHKPDQCRHDITVITSFHEWNWFRPKIWSSSQASLKNQRRPIKWNLLCCKRSTKWWRFQNVFHDPTPP